MSERLSRQPNVHVKIWVDDDSFDASFSIPVTATPEQIRSFTQAWFGSLAEALKLESAQKEQP